MMDQHFKQDWESRLKESPFQESGFTEELKRKVRLRTNSSESKKTVRIAALSGISICMVILLAMFVPGMLKQGGQDAGQPPSMTDASYYENDKLVMQVFADPGLIAGKSFGYLFHFTDPIETFIDKGIRITATHEATGQNVTAMSSVQIKGPSSGYSGLHRFTPSFALPLEGLWRFEVWVDNELHAIVQLNVGEPDWKPSSVFTLTRSAEGKAGEIPASYRVTGVPDRIAFINPGFVAGKTNKYMWFLPMPIQERDANFRVMAVKQGTSDMMELFRSDSIGNDGSVPSSMMIEEPGLWRLLPFVNGELIESIVVEVKAEKE
ncbi:hypothetical protein ACFQZE_13090 [Paenibacillus sp. GCM10027627]|uniref:hypothetical protein n=1 Tax=unclassified Paenibacillus TaxID=185978 RepID=UPI003627232C